MRVYLVKWIVNSKTFFHENGKPYYCYDRSLGDKSGASMSRYDLKIDTFKISVRYQVTSNQKKLVNMFLNL